MNNPSSRATCDFLGRLAQRKYVLTRMHCLHLFVFIFIIVILYPTRQLFAVTEYSPDKIVLDLPNGEQISFRAVYIGVNTTELFSSRRVQLGSREGSDSYKEHLTETLLSGSFQGVRNGQVDMLYYIGETEVQRGQWDSIMRWAGKEGASDQNEDGAKLPKTSVTISEIYSFIEALNLWSIAHQKESLPKLHGALAYCRLPTEAEWEFAARGGIEVYNSDRTLFDSAHPYGTNPNTYEWLQSNAGKKLQFCGSPSIQPNPLGLYDMLGNAQELTINLFSPEYQQGRFGDFVIRGSDYTDYEPSASLRGEYMSYLDDGSLYRNSRIGFRLVLATRISSVRMAPNEINQAFTNYKSSVGLTQPGPVGSSSPASQAQQDQIQFLQDSIERAQQEKSKTEQQVLTLESKLTEHSNTILRLQQDICKLEMELKTAKASHPGTVQQNLLENTQHNTEKSQLTIEMLTSDNSRLRKEISELATLKYQADIAAQAEKDRSLYLAQRLTATEKDLSSLRLQENKFFSEIDKNAGRVRHVEKLYLQALLRQASANVIFGYRNLKAIEIALRAGRLNKEDELYQRRYDEAATMIRDLCILIREILEKTQGSLFQEVKRDLAIWLKERENENDLGLQRHGLDLIERYVKEARAGKYHRPEEIMPLFTSEPELQLKK